MPYATYSEFLEHFGVDRAAVMVDGAETLRETVVERALSGAAGLINVAATRGGYIVPIDATALTSTTALQDQIEDMLRLKEIVIATVFYLQPLDETRRIREARAECKAWMEELAAGGGLPVLPPVAAGDIEDVFAWIGDDGATEDYTPKTLATGREVGL